MSSVANGWRASRPNGADEVLPVQVEVATHRRAPATGSRARCRPRSAPRRGAAAGAASARSSSRSCVAISSVTPTSLKRANSSMISSDSSGSRLPVGSSAISTSGRGATRARDADALLLAGRERDRRVRLAAEQADLVERRAHALLDLAAARARDHERQRDVVEHAAVVEQLVILEHDAEPLPKRAGSGGAGSAPCSGCSRARVPRVGRSISAISRSSVLLPAPDGPVRNANSPRSRLNDDAR